MGQTGKWSLSAYFLDKLLHKRRHAHAHIYKCTFVLLYVLFFPYAEDKKKVKKYATALKGTTCREMHATHTYTHIHACAWRYHATYVVYICLVID